MSTFTDGVVPLSAPIDGEEYMRLLLDRQATWEATHPSSGGLRPQPWVRPLLEWFIVDADEQWVRLPEDIPAPKRKPTPRVYRSAESIRAELAKVDAEMARVAGDDTQDGAVVNLSPNARSRAARNAGRRRFAKLDRDLQRYAELRRRRDGLAGRLASAEAREAKTLHNDQAGAATAA